MRRTRWPRAIALLAVALAAAGCMPASSTSQGQAIRGLYVVFFVAAAIVFLIVAGLVTWSIVRYRHRGPTPADQMPLPPQYHGDLRLEVLWTAIPILTVVGLFAATLGTLSIVQARAPDELPVHVTAFRWQWTFDYTGASVTITGTPAQAPILVVPVGRTVHVTLTSSDVNHAFFVPAFLFKQDAIPGHPNEFDFKVTEAGTYRGQCAEFCGVYHDAMIFSVRAVSPAEFDAWLAAQRTAASPSPPAALPAASPSPTQ